MKKVLLFILILACFFHKGASEYLNPQFFALDKQEKKLGSVFHEIYREVVYFGAGCVLEAISLTTGIGGALCQIFPKASLIGKELGVISYCCGDLGKRSFAQLLKPSFLSQTLPSQYSWRLNESLLAHIPANNPEEEELLHFLKKRWLAKSAGFYSSIVDWVCPCFGIALQVHPETSNTYARDPVNKLPENYKIVVEEWKKKLHHPLDFPLILTRPFPVQTYLPTCLEVSSNEKIENSISKLALLMEKNEAKVVVDVTDQIPLEDPNTWFSNWCDFRDSFCQKCLEKNLDLSRIVCIQKVKNRFIGGIRLLPLCEPTSVVEEQHQFLLLWISKFGLSANRVELDRWCYERSGNRSSTFPLTGKTKESFLSFLRAFEERWASSHPQKALMMNGTLCVLKGLFESLPEEKWQDIQLKTAHSLICQISFIKIEEKLSHLEKEGEALSFFEFATCLEEIHADLAALLEICMPFTKEDFPSIYLSLLKSVPPTLHDFTLCGIHSSGMTSLGGVFKAVENAKGSSLHVICGENSYFENIMAANLITKAIAVEEAKEEDFEKCDLFLAQFNPVLKRVDSSVKAYKLERVADNLQKTLNARNGKPLTLAIDCTLDFIDSPRVAGLLKEFEEEIVNGHLNVVCYRSGLKFDLFGMDNYCGAPCFMVHNKDSKWDSFDALLKDEVLQSDRLSLNWFCLAYQYAPSQLDLYRKQVFDNTEALLEKIPSRLLEPNATGYRVVPFEKGAETTFVHIMITGPFHQVRGSTVMSGIMTTKCMGTKHPLFNRQSMGFYHSNSSVLYFKDCTTIRLTLGLDPEEVNIFAECFEIIDSFIPQS